MTSSDLVKWLCQNLYIEIKDAFKEEGFTEEEADKVAFFLLEGGI